MSGLKPIYGLICGSWIDAFQHVILNHINTSYAARTRKKKKKTKQNKTILATGCEVMGQVLLPAAEKQEEEGGWEI